MGKEDKSENYLRLEYETKNNTQNAFRKITEEHNLSGHELAQILECSDATVSNIISFKAITSLPNVITYRMLAEAFNISIDEIVFGKKSEKHSETVFTYKDFIKYFIKMEEHSVIEVRPMYLDGKKGDSRRLHVSKKNCKTANPKKVTAIVFDDDLINDFYLIGLRQEMRFHIVLLTCKMNVMNNIKKILKLK